MNDRDTSVRSRLLVRFAHRSGEVRFESYRALIDMGEKALPTLRAGLQSEHWQVRRWSAMCLDQVADADALDALVPLVNDPHPKVRLWAVHSIACEHCKDDVECPVDVVPLLIERVLRDSNVKVRRMAAIMLGTELRDSRAIPALREVAADSADAKLVAHARRGLAHLEALT